MHLTPHHLFLFTTPLFKIKNPAITIFTIFSLDLTEHRIQFHAAKLLLLDNAFSIYNHEDGFTCKRHVQPFSHNSGYRIWHTKYAHSSLPEHIGKLFILHRTMPS